MHCENAGINHPTDVPTIPFFPELLRFFHQNTALRFFFIKYVFFSLIKYVFSDTIDYAIRYRRLLQYTVE